MIDYIKGSIAELTPTSVVIECNSIGYMAHISLNTYSALNGCDEAKLYIHESIREDAHVLFGFSDRDEREVFLHLISVSGVGPGTARVILSSLSAGELSAAVASENVPALQAVKGIGAKTAQRIIVDLRGKLKPPTGADATQPLPTAGAIAPIVREAVAALVMLGFSQAASQKVADKVAKDNPSLPVEAIIKEALKRL